MSKDKMFFIRKSLGYKIGTFFLVFIVVPLIVLLFLTNDELKKITLRENSSRLVLARQMVENFLKNKRVEMQVRIKNLSEKLLDSKSPLETLKIYKEPFGYTSIILKNLSDQSEQLIGESNIIYPQIKKLLIDNARNNNWVSLLWSQGNNLYLGGSASFKKQGIGQYIIIACSRLSTRNFLNQLHDITNMKITIFNKDRIPQVTTSLGIDNTLTMMSSDISSKLDKNKNVIKIMPIMGENHLVSFSLLNLDNENAIKIKIPSLTKAYLAIAIPSKLISKSNWQQLIPLIIVTAAAIFLAFIIALILSRHIVIPLNIFSKAAKKISEGDFDTEIKLNRVDEIGELVNSFNQMTKKLQNSYSILKRKIFEISVLYKISQMVNFESNSESLLKNILKETCLSLNAQKASIFLLNPQSDELELRMVYGVEGKLIKKRISIHLGEGIAGKVLETGEGVIINEGEKHPDFLKNNKISDYGVSTLMCVPLKIKDKTFGVLNVSNKTGNKPFNENDLKLFKALAAQIAINIENTKLYELSITDGITKLFIHRHFQVRLEEEVIRARRYNSIVSLIMLDIDHFKKFNDTYGHQTGDLVLIKVAETIKNTIRTNVDIAARYGGEEFAIILPETSKEESRLLGERLRKNIESETLSTSKYGELKITVSIGIASFPTNASNKSELISKADAALYEAKETGRNKVCVCES